MAGKGIIATSLLTNLDRATGIPIYHQLCNGLREMIRDGRIVSGTRLPPSRLFASELKISRNTVLIVYEQLIAEGYLIGRRGDGTYVAEKIPDGLLQVGAKAPASSSTAVKSTQRNVSSRFDVLDGLSIEFPERPRAFQTGTTAIDEFPIELWTKILSHRLRRMPRNFLDYRSPYGYLPLREAISAHLGSARGVRCDPDQVIIVSGSQQALDVTSRVLFDRGDSIMIEDPCYSGARAAFLCAGIHLIPLPIDAEGIDLTWAPDVVGKVKAIYVTPSHQFPTGVVMSLSRRRELLKWADKNSAWIIEDDYDAEFRYDGKPISAMQGLDYSGRVIYLGTFSKVLFPSLRIGYLVLPHDLIAKFARALAFMTLHTSYLEQVALSDFMHQGHFAKHIRKMRVVYSERQHLLVDEINAHLSEYIDVEPESAGVHLIGHLKERRDAATFSRHAFEKGVVATPTSTFSIQHAVPPGLLLGYSGLNGYEIRTGVRRLKAAFDELLNT